MINKAIYFLKSYLQQEAIFSTDDGSVEVGNIGFFEKPTTGDRKLIITLVNTEEEFTKKNYPFVRKDISEKKAEYKNRSLFLNLYILISAHYGDYDTALKMLSRTIHCFQAKNVFTASNATFEGMEDLNDIGLTAKEERKFKLYLDLYTMTFEQQNHLWGTLGGKQFPSVVYKARLIEIEKEKVHAGGGVVEEIQLSSGS